MVLHIVEISGCYDFDGQTNTVDVYIRALRNKLGKYRDLIKTVRGIGYVLGDEQ